jgi:hypothetical protein
MSKITITSPMSIPNMESPRRVRVPCKNRALPKAIEEYRQGAACASKARPFFLSLLLLVLFALVLARGPAGSPAVESLLP